MVMYMDICIKLLDNFTLQIEQDIKEKFKVEMR